MREESYHSSSVKSCRRKRRSFDRLRMTGGRRAFRFVSVKIHVRPFDRLRVTGVRLLRFARNDKERKGVSRYAPTSDEEPLTLPSPSRGEGQGGCTAVHPYEKKERA